MKLKIMTFNIQHCRNYNFPDEDRIDFDVMANVIREENADICGLNEVRGSGEIPSYTEQARILAEKLGMYFYFSPAVYFNNHGWYGNAILSKYPIASSETCSIPMPDNIPEGKYVEPRAVLKAYINVSDKFLNVFVTHFGLTQAEAYNASSTAVELLSKASSPKVLMGDFNLTPESPILDPIRILMADTADMFKNSKLSFPSDKPIKKIDYIFVSDDINIIDADIPAVVASDHRPHTAIIEI